MLDNCAVCFRYKELDRDHIKTRGSGGTDDDWNIWLICRDCHIDKHRRGLSWIVKTYPHTKILLRLKGWELVDVFGVMKLQRING